MMAGNLPSTTGASLGTKVRQSACFMSGLFPRSESEYSTRAPAYQRPLSGHPRPGQPQIDGQQPSKYNKGFTRDGGVTVGACFISGLFPRCECEYFTCAPAYQRPLSGHPRPGQPQIDGLQPSKYNKGFTRSRRQRSNRKSPGTAPPSAKGGCLGSTLSGPSMWPT